jgi:hypothetical protein
MSNDIVYEDAPFEKINKRPSNSEIIRNMPVGKSFLFLHGNQYQSSLASMSYLHGRDNGKKFRVRLEGADVRVFRIS